MFQIPENKLLKKDKSYTDALQKYLSDTSTLPVINITNKQTGLDYLNLCVNNEQFFFVLDMKNNSIIQSTGIKNCLGYDSSRFSIKNYIEIIHPAHAVVQSLYALALFDFFLKERIEHNELVKLTYVCLIALLNKNGKYIYYKKESRPLLITRENKILQYTNFFTTVKEFTNEHYCFRIYDNTSQRFDLEEKIRVLVKKQFEKKSGFSTQELRILKRYASQENITSETIANSFKIEKSTVSTYNKRILDKAENIFDYRFENAQKVAAYFKNMSLI